MIYKSLSLLLLSGKKKNPKTKKKHLDLFLHEPKIQEASLFSHTEGHLQIG